MNMSVHLLASLVVASGVAATPGIALAQPSLTPPTIPQPYEYAVAAPLSPGDVDVLQRGEISDGEQLGGVALALTIGFGAGHALEGRWRDSGWIYTLGESGIIAATIGGALALAPTCERSCTGGPGASILVVSAGLLAFGGFRIAEIADVVSGAHEHNARVRALRARLASGARLAPYVARASDADGYAAGVALRF